MNETDQLVRIREIQTRIAALRSRLERSEESNQTTQIEPKCEKGREVRTDEDKRVNKNKELEDIKAKLLGRKK